MCPVTGGNITTIVSDPLMGGGNGIRGLVVDQSGVYWTETSPNYLDYAGQLRGVRGVPVDDANLLAQTMPTVFATNLFQPNGLCLDAQWIYWIEADPYSNLRRGAVKKVAKNGGMPRALGSNLGELHGIVVDSDNVYFGEWNGPVYKVPISGGDITSVGGYTASDFLAIDATYIYETFGNEIRRMSKAAGTFSTVVTGLQQPWGIAVDKAGVYWTDEVTTVPGNGKIGMAPIQTGTPTPTPSPTTSPTATPGLVGNVATRLPVGAGENVLIEGFIVQGPVGSSKRIMVRAIGPSLAQFGIIDALANPSLEVHDASNAVIAINNDWKTTQVGGLIAGDQLALISGSQLAPSNDLESALIVDLSPGSYTAVVRGVGNTVGTGLVDAYDLNPASPARLANIATRGLIQTGDKLMIAGFIVLNGPVKAVVRATGASLAAFGVNNALPDTTLQLRDANGALVVENDDWKVRSDGSSQQAEMEASGLQPSNDLEAAFIATIPPGQYTAQVRGKGDTAGVGVVEVYFLQ